MKTLMVLVAAIFFVTACNNEKVATANADDQTKKIMVEVKEISPETFAHYFSANGSLEAVEDAFISPELGGQVREIHVREGQRVRKGQLLVSLNDSVIERSISEVKTGLELARVVYMKRKGLWDKKIGSEIQYLEAKTNKESLENKLKTLEAQLALTRVTAPINGIVDEIAKKKGELSVPGMLLVRVVNLKMMYANADVSEAYLAKIKTGDPVTVTFPSLPDVTVRSKIQRIGSVVNPQNRTFKVTVMVDNRNEQLKPNVVAVLKMKDFQSDAALVVPSIIIKEDMKGTYVYIVQEDGGKAIARKTYVKPGISESTHTMIDSGLKAGQRVIVEGYSLVKNGVEVEIAK